MPFASSDLRTRVVAALKAANTGAGQRVYSPRDWPLIDGILPAILVSTPSEDMTPRNDPTQSLDYTTVSTVRIEARVEAPAQAGTGNAGAAAALAALEALQPEIIAAVVNNNAIDLDPDGSRRIEGVAFIRARNGTSAEGERHYGSLVVDLGYQYLTGIESFHDNTTTDIDEITVKRVLPDDSQIPALDFPNLQA